MGTAAPTAGPSCPSIPSPPKKRSRHQVVTHDPSESLGMGDGADGANAQSPQGLPPPSDMIMGVASLPSHTATPASHYGSEPLRASPCLPEPSDAAEDSSAYAETLEGGSGSRHGLPFYPGDRRGPAFLMDICEPHRSSTSNHCVVNMPSTKSLPPEDVNYLRIKGAFTLPPRHIQDALVQCYFHHVHPFAPILDPFQFIVDYENNRASLLLLWSMFGSSASVWWPHPCPFQGPMADYFVAVHRQQLAHPRLLSFPPSFKARCISTGKGVIRCKLRDGQDDAHSVGIPDEPLVSEL